MTVLGDNVHVPTDQINVAAVLATVFQNDVKSFCLQIAEDDGEVDLDFPGIHHIYTQIKKIEFHIK